MHVCSPGTGWGARADNSHGGGGGGGGGKLFIVTKKFYFFDHTLYISAISLLNSFKNVLYFFSA